jgi:uroporphyrinogen-III synthase
MRALITRPIEDAEQVAFALQARGIEPLFEPLLAITPTPGVSLDLAGVQALLVTSRNGVRVLAGVTPVRDIPLYAVGDATAQVAKDLGFKTVESAGGDADALAKLVAGKLDPKAGPLVHAAGQAVAGDLIGRLAEQGFVVRREVLYQANPATVLSESTRDLLNSDTVDLVLFFSPRTAQTFVALVTEAGVADKCGRIATICLSSAIASRVTPIAWRAVVTSDRPDLQALLSVIDGLQREAVVATPVDGKPAAEAATAPPRSAKPAASPWRASRRSGGSWRVWAVVGVIGIVAIAVLSWPVWRGVAPQWARDLLAPAPTAPAPVAPATQSRDDVAARGLADRLAALERRLAQPAPPLRDDAPALERRLAEVEARLADGQPPRAAAAPTTDDEVARRLAEVEGRVAALGSSDLSGRLSAAEAALRAENERLAARLADLEKRLAAVQERATQQASRDGGRRSDASILAMIQLRDAVERGAPYAAELAAFGVLVKGDPGYGEAAAALQAHAERGVVPRAELTRRFGPAAAAAARAALAPDGSDWASRTLARLSSVVTIRRVGDEVAGDKPDAAIARAEAKLRADDLAGAVAALDGLSGPPAAAMAGWLADARAAVAVERALAIVSRRALAAAAAAAN